MHLAHGHATVDIPHEERAIVAYRSQETVWRWCPSYGANCATRAATCSHGVRGTA